MRFTLKKSIPSKLANKIRELKTLCGNEQTFFEIFQSNPKILFQQNIYSEKIDEVYYLILTYIDTYLITEYRLPRRYGANDRFLNNICHINFENLKTLELANCITKNLESLIFLNAPCLETIDLSNHRFGYCFSLKCFTKTQFPRLRSLNVQNDHQTYKQEDLKHLHRTQFLFKRAKSLTQNKRLYESQLSKQIEESPQTKNLLSIGAKMPTSKFDNYSFHQESVGWKFQNGLIQIKLGKLFF